MEPWSMQPVIILHYSELGTLGKTIGLLVRLGYPIGGRDKKIDFHGPSTQLRGDRNLL
jgi:hypothetical protein